MMKLGLDGGKGWGKYRRGRIQGCLKWRWLGDGGQT